MLVVAAIDLPDKLGYGEVVMDILATNVAVQKLAVSRGFKQTDDHRLVREPYSPVTSTWAL